MTISFSKRTLPRHCSAAPFFTSSHEHNLLDRWQLTALYDTLARQSVVHLTLPIPITLNLYVTSYNSRIFLSLQWLGSVLDAWGSIPKRGREFFSSSSRPDRIWGPPSLLSSGY